MLFILKKKPNSDDAQIVKKKPVSSVGIEAVSGMYTAQLNAVAIKVLRYSH